MANSTVTLTIRADAGQLVGEVKLSAKALSDIGKTGQDAGEKASAGLDAAARSTRALGPAAVAAATASKRSHRDIANGIDSISVQLARAQKLYGAWIIASQALQGVAGLARLADQYTNLSSKIRNVVSSEEELNRVREQTFDIAQNTRASFESTVELYTRLTRATADLGTSQADNLRITEIINKAFVVSGASAGEANAAIIQLAQGLSAGALRGDEFNSVAEQAPILMDLLSKSLGMTRGELRAYAAEGKITAEIVTTALLEGGASVDAQFDKMSLTIGGAATQLKNAAVAFVGGTSEMTGSAALVASTIGLIAKHLDTLVTAGLTLAVLWLGKLGAGLVTSAAQWLLNTQQVLLYQAALARMAGTAPVVATGLRGMAAAAGALSASLGVISLVALAIGGLALGIKALIDAEEERQAKFAEGIQQMRDSAQAARDLADGFREISLVPFKPLPGWDATLKQYAESTKLLTERQAEYNAKRKELDGIEAGIAAKQAYMSEAKHGLALAAMAQEAARLKDELAALAPALDEAKSSTDQLGAVINTALAPAARDAAQALDQLMASRNATSFVGNLIGGFQGLATNLGLVKKNIDEFNSTGATLEATLAGVEAKLKTHGKTTADIIKIQFEAHKATALWAEAGDAEKRALEALVAQRIIDAQSMEKSIKPTTDARDATADYVASLQEQVAALQREADTYGMTAGAIILYDAAKRGQIGTDLIAAQSAAAAIDVLTAEIAARKEAAAALASLRGLSADAAGKANDLRAKLTGANAAQTAFNKTLHAAEIALEAAGGAMSPEAVAAYGDAIAAALENIDLENAQTLIDSIGNVDGIDAITAAIGVMEDALRSATDPDIVAGLTAALGKLHGKLKDNGEQMQANNLALMQQGVSSLQRFAKEGTAAYTALGIAQDILAYKSAIAGIANQAAGDPYTAFARIAAMIALMASIGIRVAGSGPSFTDTAAQRQETQGTGSVLGDSEAKSESIANAVEITAAATSELVGINRGMLRALQSLQSGLSSAGGMLARGAGEVDFAKFDPGFMLNARNGAMMGAAIGSIIPVIGTAIGAVLGAVLGSILGGSSRLTDQGIAIGGGSIGDANFQAYQEHQVRSWRFGSRRTVEQTADLPDDVANQFQMVMDSIVDTVREGALALGLLPADIEAAIAAYQIEATHISLKGLSAEEQQAELAAVFGKIFDGLAGDVVPFIAQFQRVGEGLGETLVRIATEVQVVQEAMRYLGIAIDETDPERFAQISDALIEASGGIEAFISGMQSFAKAFAPESFQFSTASSELADAFAQVGLAVPATRDGMWELMQSLDATTESGREQIATLLRLAGVADQYYSLLDKQIDEATKLLDKLGLSALPMSDFARSLVEIHQSGADAVDAANTLAIAQGRTGASSIQLAKIHQWTASQIAQAIKKLVEQTQDLIAQLYGGVPGSLDAINARIAELEGATVGLSDGIGEVADAGADMFQSWLTGIQSIQDYLDSMLFGDLSALTPEEQLAEAQRQLLAMQARALGGDTEALNQLPQLADQFLQLLRGSGASGADYNTGFDWVRQLLQSVVDMPNPYSQAGDGGAGTVELVPSQELRDLYAARDLAQAQADLEQRREWALQLAQNLADMATIFQIPVLELMEAQGVSLAALAADLGVDLDNLGLASVQAIGNMAVTLGVSLSTLTSSLGISLVDLRGGLTEITDSMGIDLGALTVETTQSLAALAASMGTNLFDLSEALGIDLGSLTDATSLINQGLGTEISALPEDQATALTPLFDAITNATTEADANAAIQALEDAVNLIGGETANALAPYLAGVFPVSALDQLDYLSEIQEIAAQQLDVLGLIRDNLKASNSAAGVPSYAVGTGYVPSTGLAMIHEGEGIIPAPVNAWLHEHGYPTGGGDNTATLAELRALREEVAALRRENNAANDKIASTVSEGDSKARIQRDDLSRRDQPQGRSRTG